MRGMAGARDQHSTLPTRGGRAAASTSRTPESRMHGDSTHQRPHLPSADHQWLDVQEQGHALQPGRPRRLLRRIDVRGADCLGPPLRARRRLSRSSPPTRASAPTAWPCPDTRPSTTTAPFRHGAGWSNEVHQYDCRYIIQLHFSGRQRDIPRKEFVDIPAPGATDRPDLLYGLRSRRMTIPEIHELVQAYARAARRAREAGADGIEIVACNGYILHQFLSSAINDRDDEYNGDLRARARLTLEVLEAVRAAVGRDFFVSMKLSGRDEHNAYMAPLVRAGGEYAGRHDGAVTMAGRRRTRRHPSLPGRFVSTPADPGRPAAHGRCETRVHGDVLRGNAYAAHVPVPAVRAVSSTLRVELGTAHAVQHEAGPCFPTRSRA